MIYVCFWSKISIVVAMATKQNIKKDEIDTFCSVFYQLSVNWAKLSPFSAKLKKLINKFQVKEFMNFCESGLLWLPWKLSNVKMRNFLFFQFVVKMSVKDHITKKPLFADAAVRFHFVYFANFITLGNCRILALICCHGNRTPSSVYFCYICF